jgi:hypothetical protein
MIAVILHAKSPLDQRRYALRGPQFRTIAVCRGSLQQEHSQFFLLLLG